MTSTRFPGKVLAPLAGRPLVDHVFERLGRALPPAQIHLLTTVDPADDPLARHAEELGIDVYRGPRDDVVERFLGCLESRVCEWFFRVSADSPLLDPELAPLMLDLRGDGVDLVTNVFPRSYPKGQSLELVRSASFAALARTPLTADQREHVTKGFYDSPEAWSIVNLTAPPGTDPELAVVVDTVEDLRRLEASLGS